MKFLIFGGSGRLATELTKQLSRTNIFVTVPHEVADVTDETQVLHVLRTANPDIVINCAGILSPLAEREKLLARRVNFVGAAVVSRICSDLKIRLVHISTDCVFDGTDTPPYGYTEFASRNAVNNYGHTKSLGEVAVGINHPAALILRVPFRYRGPWPYPKAFIDAYQSSRWIDEVAPDIIAVSMLWDVTGVLHIGGERKSIFQMAREASPEVLPCRLKDFTEFIVAEDRTLDSSKWKGIKKEYGL